MHRSNSGDNRVGITTTVPIEIIYAAGFVPVDLNNIFINAANPAECIARAEKSGLPRNCCAWTKGVYGACHAAGITRIVGVTQGDCSNTSELVQLWASEGIQTIEFGYPHDRNADSLRRSLEAFAAEFGSTIEDGEEYRLRLSPVRQMLLELDELSADNSKVTAAEAHSWLVSASDFNGNPDKYASELESFLKEARKRPGQTGFLPLLLAGVPPIAADFFETLQELGLSVVCNEVPREFSMIRSLERDLCAMYLNYSYPYDARHRIAVLKEMLELRRPIGVLHYLQSFCHRQIGARLLKEGLPIPVFSLECDRPGRLDASARTRLESLAELLRNRSQHV
jgi:benzoyl-CoA reductase/2-hydroxyglutaryl-CoA dehydratase subunit BcrC/BadD/HgdB